MQRRDRENYYLDIAQAVLGRGTCLAPEFRRHHCQERSDSVHRVCGRAAGAAELQRSGRLLAGKAGGPRGERYELCRSVHAEANAIIHASRSEMTGATLYLVGVDAQTEELVPDASPCSMCKRMIINAGISRVIIRNTPDSFTAIYVQDWIENDGPQGERGY